MGKGATFQSSHYNPLGKTIETAELTDGSVTEAKIGSDAVTTTKIKAGEITNSHISSSAAIALSKLASIPGYERLGVYSAEGINSTGEKYSLNIAAAASVFDIIEVHLEVEADGGDATVDVEHDTHSMTGIVVADAQNLSAVIRIENLQDSNDSWVGFDVFGQLAGASVNQHNEVNTGVTDWMSAAAWDFKFNVTGLTAGVVTCRLAVYRSLRA